MRTSLEIQNLKCGGCGTTVSNWLGKIEDVNEISVNVDDGTVNFSHTKESTLDRVRQTLARLGYPAMDAKNTFCRKINSYISCAMGKLEN